MAERRPPKVPAHLSGASRRLYTETLRAYELEPWHVATLIKALESLDRAEEARLRIEADGAYLVNRFGEPRPHPALAVSRDSLATYRGLLRELALDIEGPPSAGRGR